MKERVIGGLKLLGIIALSVLTLNYTYRCNDVRYTYDRIEVQTERKEEEE